MQVIHTSSRGIDYLSALLCRKQRTETRAVFWRIPHNDETIEDICLKLGRYSPRFDNLDAPEKESPRSELTLDHEEFLNLIAFLEQNYEPFRKREPKWIPVQQEMSQSDAELLRRFFDREDSLAVMDFLLENGILSDELLGILERRVRERALAQFRDMLSSDLVEPDWQAWFKTNDWILGTDIVRVIDDRRIDTENIADYLVEAHDGFLDVVEIKRPEGGLRFWAQSRDNGNLIPSTDLVKAITQTVNYVHQIELEADSRKFADRVGLAAVKPRATLIFGRSDSWAEDERIAYRVLNRSYHALSVLTYDHVLARAERLLGR